MLFISVQQEVQRVFICAVLKETEVAVVSVFLFAKGQRTPKLQIRSKDEISFSLFFFFFAFVSVVTEDSFLPLLCQVVRSKL